jgi:hypothetical protein
MQFQQAFPDKIFPIVSKYKLYLIFNYIILIMASTRNKNNPGNYKLQQISFSEYREYLVTPEYGTSYQTNFPGNGLLPGNIPRNKMSSNSADTESFLFGINSSNLVSSPRCFLPQIETPTSLDLFEKTKIIMPIPLNIEKRQRPQF